MQTFMLTINQMAYLFSLIIVGFLLGKFRVVQENAAGVLAKMENTVFIYFTCKSHTISGTDTLTQ